MKQRNIVRFVSLLSLSSGFLLCTACPAPLPYKACQTDQDCPENYACQIKQHICVPGSHFDAGQIEDISTLDVSLLDAGATDDVSSHEDAAGSDATGSDAGSLDVISPDSASSTDASGVDAGELDAGQVVPLEITSDRDSLFPGESLTLTANINIPIHGDMTFNWSFEGGNMPAGVSLQVSHDSLQVVLSVDRNIYMRGDEDVPVQISLQLLESDGNMTEAQKSITILDERGPFVVPPAGTDATQDMIGWEGQGYDEPDLTRHGFCGAARHACTHIADAQANLSALISEKPEIEPTIKVWTGSYYYDETIILDKGLKLYCGYNSWETVDPTDNAADINIAKNLGLFVHEHSNSINNCRISIFPPESGIPNPYCVANCGQRCQSAFGLCTCRG